MLWRLTSIGGAPGVERLEDDGTTFNATHQALSPSATAGALAATANEAWVLGSETTAGGPLSLLHLTLEQGGGIGVRATAVPGEDPAGVALGSEATLLFTDTEEYPNTQFSGMWRLSLAPREGGLIAAGEKGLPVGADPEALWLMHDSNSGSAATDLKAAWLDGKHLRTAALQLPRGSRADPTRRMSGLMPYFGAPLVSRRGACAFPPHLCEPVAFVVPRLEGGQLSLESFDAGAGFAPVSAATSRHAFARALDAQSLKVFVR